MIEVSHRGNLAGLMGGWSAPYRAMRTPRTKSTHGVCVSRRATPAHAGRRSQGGRLRLGTKRVREAGHARARASNA